MDESLGDIADEIKKSDVYSKGVQKKRTERIDNIEMIIEKLFKNWYEHCQIQLSSTNNLKHKYNWIHT